MDARLFSRMLTELLCSREQVVLTGFGTFHTELVPAYFSDKGFTLNPPYLKVCFRIGTDSDDALAILYSESNNIGLDAAREVINGYIASIRKELSQNKFFAIPGLGRLRSISRDNVFFIPDDGLLLFPGYDSLEPVSLKSLSAIPEQPAPEEHPVSIPESIPEQPAPEEHPVSIPEQPAGEKTVDGGGKRVFPIMKLLLVLLLAAALFLGALALAGRFFPDVIDPWLYSPQELKIIRYKF